MRLLTELSALTMLRRAKAHYQTHVVENYERRALSCARCPDAGVCCTDEHFVNNHITRLEAVAVRETLRRTPRLTDDARRRVYARAAAAVARHNLRASLSNELTYRQTYSCPLFEPGAGCLVHRRAKPAPCIQHACYEDWQDVPPIDLQWRAEHRVEQLNRQAYGDAWAWLPLPLWLTLVDPDNPEGERQLAALARAWAARRSRGQARTVRRALPVLR